MQTNLKKLDMQHGLTLTEILVAVVVLSIGLLGMAGIQMKGLRGTHNTYLRSQATALTTDLAERVRANPTGILKAVAGTTTNKNYSLIDFSSTTDCSTEPTTICDSVDGTAAANCSAAQITEYDIYSWMCGSSSADTVTGVRNILPATTTATATCTTDSDGDATNGCSPGSTLTITLNWDDRALGDERDADNNVVVTNPQSLTMVVVP